MKPKTFIEVEIYFVGQGLAPAVWLKSRRNRQQSKEYGILRTRKITDDYATRQISNPMTAGHWRVDAPCPLQNKNPPLTRWGSGFLGRRANFASEVDSTKMRKHFWHRIYLCGILVSVRGASSLSFTTPKQKPTAYAMGLFWSGLRVTRRK